MGLFLPEEITHIHDILMAGAKIKKKKPFQLQIAGNSKNISRNYIKDSFIKK
jgi:hypothetical protein